MHISKAQMTCHQTCWSQGYLFPSWLTSHSQTLCPANVYVQGAWKNCSANTVSISHVEIRRWFSLLGGQSRDLISFRTDKTHNSINDELFINFFQDIKHPFIYHYLPGGRGFFNSIASVWQLSIEMMSIFNQNSDSIFWVCFCLYQFIADLMSATISCQPQHHVTSCQPQH